MEPTVHDVVIVGSGPAGYTAALYAARAGLSTRVFAGAPSLEDPERLPGGQLVTTSLVENFPGFPEGIDGSELMERMRAQAERHGAVISLENVLSLGLGAQPYRVESEGEIVLARSLIIATGAAARFLGVPGEQTYRNRGVFACATCDGPLYAGRDVLVIGGGDTALEEALYLSRFVKSVRVVHRRSTLRASHALRERTLHHPKLSFVWNSTVESILGDGEKVTGARVWNAHTAEAVDLDADAVFVAIGHTPATGLLEGALDLHPEGYIVTQKDSTQTSLAGVFACGDVVDATYRQAITAAGSGAKAALDAERFLRQLELPRGVRSAA